ncbi:hypothetical protein GBAR_LOCUS2712 [Geodia barretti]|uniref:Uncharacterized protein n=1 Tax=Geodia barretti TaxID=519541 RepID=A0AA35R0L9_GEOBA|nr:hypothetical protein GBAR_LOCUS2712 [Geodia barretti]
MVLKGEDWLAQTVEATLEPDLPICDTHHHFWVARPEPAAYQRYLLPDLTADVSSGHNVRSTVFIEVRCEYRQSGPEEMRPVGEIEYIETIATESATGSHGTTKAAAAHHRARGPETWRCGASGAGGDARRQPGPLQGRPALDGMGHQP